VKVLVLLVGRGFGDLLLLNTLVDSIPIDPNPFLKGINLVPTLNRHYARELANYPSFESGDLPEEDTPPV